jgi:very-short-patch-repair endonuclease
MTTIQYDKSFASHEKAKYWSIKNNVKPNEITKESPKKFLFNCNVCNHEFIKQINLITRLNGWCSYCSNRNLCGNNNCKMCFDNSFASHEKSAFWSDKNELTPRQVFKVSAKKYLFKCDICKHEFINNPSHVSNRRWCPYCCVPQKQLCGSKECSDCYNKSFASHEKSIYWSDKNEFKPEFVMKKGDKRIWFNCDKCDHDFETQIKGITKGQWCPYCNSHKLCENNDCINCFNRSFASHEKSKYWSSKNDILPRQIVKGSGEKYWFDCNKCNHNFEKVLCDVTGEKEGWCPYCVNKKICDNDECIDCYNKSFASHEKVKYWSSKNTANPRYLFQGDSNRYWFNCNKCSHDFDTLLYNVKSGYWCPYCSNSKLCIDDECIDCYNKSFASHIILKSWIWSNKNTDNPQYIFKYSNNKYWFECNLCKNEFERAPHTLGNRYNNVCPFCRYKTEFKVYDKLKPIYQSIIRDFKQDWCKKINHLPFDFCITENKIIIELDGPQHFIQIPCWKPLDLVQENDKYKEECANNNGYSIIRLLQTDVLNDTYDWLKELCEEIEELKNGHEIANVYLCKNNEYQHFN